MKWTITSILIWVLSFNCSQTIPDHLEVLTWLPEEMRENSGLETVPGSDLIWSINDSGNKDHLYGLDIQGKIVKEFNIKGAVNEDWEDIAADEKGNVYIADIGNNSYKRDELFIYKLPNPASATGDDMEAEEIEFRYPGHKKNQPINAEALVYHKGRLYIFSKDENEEEEELVKVYSVPAASGKYTAKLVAEIPACDDNDNCRVTAADISPDGKTLALLTYDKVLLAANFLGTDEVPKFKVIDLEHRTQKEGLCFYDHHTLLLSDERSHGEGGVLYRFELPR
ncbi:hypothetical protein E7Z59_05345 [Robertkochia marina]|uniref:PE-PGRS family protein n=1 Tax=Robertkochia marina TaxID=1227945 RepID=A0A4S3M3K9_9FLAO|nr:hypothetical protein [Robertkochia marina]THD69754.1 hypothetical protein E7Z59_05345 [Robertkochia marina]TRZ46903.1 hypothetical protein D3A96_04865 [Robertkochia marina]